MKGVSEQAEGYLQELLGEVPQVPPVQEMLGARLADVEEGEATFEMQAGERCHNVVRVVHGGIITSLAELAASTAILTTLGEDEAFTFVSQTTNYERPVVDSLIQATATVIRRGRRISFIEVLVRNEGGKEVARAEFTALSQQIDGQA